MTSNHKSISDRGSFFNKNPRITGMLVALCFLLVLMVVWEVFLGRKKSGDYNPYYISLRLHSPNVVREIKPSLGHLDMVDGQIELSTKYRTDEYGFLGPFSYKDPDQKILFLGGSTTECMHIRENERFPLVVAKSLSNRKGVRVNAYNGSRSGNNSLHSITTLLNVGLSIKPHYVVMMHNINDLSILIHDGSYWGSSRSLLSKYGKTELFQYLKNATFPNIYDQLYPGIASLRSYVNHNPDGDEFERTRLNYFDGDVEVMRQSFKANLIIFINICKGHGVMPVLMTQPNRFKQEPDPIVKKAIHKLSEKGIDYNTYREFYTSFNEIVRKVAKENSIILVELDGSIPKTNEYFYDSVHLSNKGSLKVAEIIVEKLAE